MKKMNPFAGSSKGRSWFWWGINIGLFLILALYWWNKNQPGGNGKDAKKLKLVIKPSKEPQKLIVVDHRPAQEKAPDPEELRVIEGLGPRSAQALEEAGIVTFAAIAAMNPDEIHAVLKTAGVRVPFPATWPEQAALAAAGKWDALNALKEKL